MTQSQDVKVVILGEAGVGKSNILLRFVYNTFSEEYGISIGGSFMSKSVTYGGLQTKFRIWDTAGGERYRSLAPMYYKDANVALLVYDITSKESFDNLTYWIGELHRNGPQEILFIVVGNKIDLTSEEEVPIDIVSSFAKEHSALFKLTSAKEGKGVEDLFKKIAEEIADRNLDIIPQHRKYSQNLKPKDPVQKDSSCC